MERKYFMQEIKKYISNLLRQGLDDYLDIQVSQEDAMDVSDFILMVLENEEVYEIKRRF
jgi:hypothetical protein